ncbi:hypothetical protein FKP32DRAFT_998265 [Trametes sanguinea]|nr:hypothetical protein FKP32DRAFT_998265 [Trametes sanguinea]
MAMEFSSGSSSSSTLDFLRPFPPRRPSTSFDDPLSRHNTQSPLAASSSSSPGSSIPADSRPRESSTAPNASGRRLRPKIALDPEQPPTALGKPRARVYVACNQW